MNDSTDLVEFERQAIAVLTPLSLEELLEIAQQYGQIHLHQHDDKTISFNIKFESLPGLSLHAKSDFHHKTITSAVCEAIARARIMVKQFKER